MWVKERTVRINGLFDCHFPGGEQVNPEIANNSFRDLERYGRGPPEGIEKPGHHPLPKLAALYVTRHTTTTLTKMYDFYTEIRKGEKMIIIIRLIYLGVL